MKRIVSSLGFAAIVLLASSAAAIPLSTVGSIDTLIDSETLANDSDATEKAYIASVLGVTVDEVTYTKIDVGGSAWVQVDGQAGVYAFDFASYNVIDPAYFLVKLGNATDSHYFYQNLASLQYGVIDLGQITASNGTITIASVSHTAGANGPTPVPEPASLAMLLFGLVSVGASRKCSLFSQV